MNDSSLTTKKWLTRYGHKLCFFIAIFIWICSLFQNVFTFGKEGQYEGFFVLIIGTIFGPGLGHIGYFAVLCKLYLVHFNIHISYPTASKKTYLYFAWIIMDCSATYIYLKRSNCG